MMEIVWKSRKFEINSIENETECNFIPFLHSQNNRLKRMFVWFFGKFSILFLPFVRNRDEIAPKAGYYRLRWVILMGFNLIK